MSLCHSAVNPSSSSLVVVVVVRGFWSRVLVNVVVFWCRVSVPLDDSPLEPESGALDTLPLTCFYFLFFYFLRYLYVFSDEHSSFFIWNSEAGNSWDQTQHNHRSLTVSSPSQ
ncbi:hypothetical protein NL108_017063 [Boleophthalmus pectinirostris]|nr:hypothetical protein NL108_017063 [Boleophthalmus pectinirostris]